MIGVALIALAFVIIFILVERERKRNRRAVQLRRLTPPLEDLNQPTQAEEDWRSAAPQWSDPRYWGGARRRP
jgi:hypothetical protein